MNETYSNFVFYREWLDQLMVIAECGTTDDLASLCSGLKRFLDGEDPEEVTPLARMMLGQMSAQITRDKDHLKEVSEKRRKNREANENKGEQTKTKADKREQRGTKQGVEEEVEVEEDVSPIGDIVCAEPLIGLPLNDGTEHEVTEEDLAEYAQLYPAVDVMQQLRNMKGWLMANPSRRKTKRGIKAFIASWLAKEQDHPRARSGTHKLTAEEILAIPAINPWSEEVST